MSDPWAGEPRPTGDSRSDDRAAEGIRHLQAAALEAIAATRAFLDIAEDLVKDPGHIKVAADVAADFLGPFIAKGRAAAAAAAATARARPAESGDDDVAPQHPRVQHIPVA